MIVWQRYSQSRRIVCHRIERSPKTVPAGGPVSQPMDIFLFHRNHTRHTWKAVRRRFFRNGTRWNCGMSGGHQQPEKPLKSILAAGLPFMAYGHFSIPPEWYQSKPGSCETSTALFTKLPALRLPGVDWYHSSGTEKCPLAANESWQQ